MSKHNFVQLYAHLIWATWNRLPLIGPIVEQRLYAAFAEKCRELKCMLHVAGGVEDHVHLLIEVAPVISISRLVGEIKGASSHLITHEVQPGQFFGWQGSYGAFSVSKRDLSAVKTYIVHQKVHHHTGKLRRDWELSTG